jgi:hypothetical protein
MAVVSDEHTSLFGSLYPCLIAYLLEAMEYQYTRTVALDRNTFRRSEFREISVRTSARPRQIRMTASRHSSHQDHVTVTIGTVVFPTCDLLPDIRHAVNPVTYTAVSGLIPSSLITSRSIRGKTSIR